MRALFLVCVALCLILAICLAVGVLTRCAFAEEWPLLATRADGFGSVYFPTGPAVTTGDDGIEFALVSGDTPLNLGAPARPWRNLYVKNKVDAAIVDAAIFKVAGVPGINTVIHFGQCVLTIQGGLITSAVVPPGNQPCP